jgi:hypothetical protein
MGTGIIVQEGKKTVKARRPVQNTKKAPLGMKEYPKEAPRETLPDVPELFTVFQPHP